MKSHLGSLCPWISVQPRQFTIIPIHRAGIAGLLSHPPNGCLFLDSFAMHTFDQVINDVPIGSHQHLFLCLTFYSTFHWIIKLFLQSLNALVKTHVERSCALRHRSLALAFPLLLFPTFRPILFVNFTKPEMPMRRIYVSSKNTVSDRAGLFLRKSVQLEFL